MQAVPFCFCHSLTPEIHKTPKVFLTVANISYPYFRISRSGKQKKLLHPQLCNLSSTGLCQAGQTVELFPSLSPEIIVREACLEDCWEVAETHCSSFFPEYTFPLDIVLRIDRVIGLISGFSVPSGCMRSVLVAVARSSVSTDIYNRTGDFKIGELEGNFNFNRGTVTGILTVDTVADFLPRKGPLRQRRTGIAYISNVAVRKKDRQKGIGKILVAEAESQARSWGCRSIALHCDANNLAAIRLYRGQGFRTIKNHASWPQPKVSPDVKFIFMMKLLGSTIKHR